MTLRTKLTVAAAGAVAIAVVVVAVTVFFIVRGQLRSQLDQTLVDLAAQVQPERDPVSGAFVVNLGTDPLEGVRGYAQFIGERGPLPPPPDVAAAPVPGEVFVRQVEPILPVSERARRVVSGSEPAYLEDVDVDAGHLRVYTRRVGPGLGIQVARPLDEIDETLGRLGFVLVALSVLGIGVAAVLGRLVARTALAPIRRLTDAAEHVSATSDLSRRIDSDGGDELGRLARRFNEMLSALETSIGAQRQLVADASHELRTPLTSIRTNIEVLQRSDDELPPEERGRITTAAVEQLDELSVLLNDLIEVARSGSVEEERHDFRLDELVSDLVDRRGGHEPDITFDTSFEACVVNGAPRRIERAVSNLLDNAIKWSPRPGVVEVGVSQGEVRVRDHGPGIDEADRPRIFDRFYRATSARAMPGFGLGLAIAKDVAEAHGGSISAEGAPGGGALLRLRLLTVP